MNARFGTRFACDETRLLTNAYADDELLVETSIAMERHLERCRHCTELVGDVHHLKRRVRHSIRAIRAPAGFAERIRVTLRNTSVL